MRATMPYKIFTTHKRSLGQGNIFAPVYHSVHRGDTWAGTPWQVHPPGQVPPARYTPSRYTPWQVHPHQVHPHQVHPQVHPLAGTPSAVHAGIWSTSGRYTSYWNALLLLPANEVCKRLCFYRCLSVHNRGACMVALGGVCGCSGGVCFFSRGMHGFFWGGGMHGFFQVGVRGFSWGGACIGYDEIRSMSGLYASYWNALLLYHFFCFLKNLNIKCIIIPNWYQNCIKHRQLTHQNIRGN